MAQVAGILPANLGDMDGILVFRSCPALNAVGQRTELRPLSFSWTPAWGCHGTSLFGRLAVLLALASYLPADNRGQTEEGSLSVQEMVGRGKSREILHFLPKPEDCYKF